MVTIDCTFVFANIQPFSHFVWVEWVKHMQLFREHVQLCPIYDIIFIMFANYTLIS